ncbi:hypothetical protein FJ872_24255 [Mesorhizobium sp. B2-5-9]|nr:hypothetical protein FJ872_24255 [Mesorhizobium sp. B2-5-9]
MDDGHKCHAGAEHQSLLTVLLGGFPIERTIVSAFEFVYFSGLTGNDLLGGVVSLLACCVLYNVIAEDRPHR